MNLKYEWTPQQEKIILAAKKQLKRNSFRIDIRVFAASLIFLEKKGIPFDHAWDEITDEISDVNGTSFWYLIFCDTIFRLFKQKNTVSFYNLCKELYFDLSWRARVIDSSTVCCLPVRIRTKGLKAAIKELDLPRIIVLYEMDHQPGEKLKYIYHAILNECRYDYFFSLLERYGHLELLSPDVLEKHFFMQGVSEDKLHFNDFYLSNFGKNDPDLWCKATRFCVLDKMILMALKHDIDTSAYIINSNGYKIPMRDFMHFINEISVELKIHLSRWKQQDKKDEYKYWNGILQAAEIFSQWERVSASKISVINTPGSPALDTNNVKHINTVK